MAKISDLKKVQLLEEAVLANDIELVQALFDEYQEFEFTARAIGLACRFCGAEMVKVLAKNNATLRFEASGQLVKKYDCRINLTGQTGLNRPYYLWTLPGYRVDGYTETIIADDQRPAVIAALNDNGLGDMGEMLYYAILYDDTVSIAALEGLGIKELSEFRTSMVSGNKGYVRDFIWTELRSEYQRVLRTEKKDKLLNILNNYIDHMPVDNIQLFQGDFKDWNDKPILDKYCSKELFEFFVKKTNILDRYKKSELLRATVLSNNKAGLEYAFSNSWIEAEKDLKSLLTYAKKNNASKAVIACIESEIEKMKSDKPAVSKEAKKPVKRDPAAAALKKMWNFKKLDDGTLKITSYKGTSLEVVIPEKIGDDAVSTLGDAVFSQWPIYGTISDELRETRKNIVSLEIPGCIKEIPDNFYSGYTYALKKLVIKEGVETIGRRAFGSCPNIEELVMPKSVKQIGEDAFRACNISQDSDTIKVRDVVNGLRYVTENGSISVTRINSVDEFGAIDIPNTINDLPVKRINFEGVNDVLNGEVVYYDGDVKELKIPASVEDIDTIPKVSERVTVAPENSCYWSDGIGLYNKNHSKLIKVCVTNIKAYEIPDGVTEIGPGAFQYARDSIEEIVLPESLVKIREKAFAQCRKIKEFYIPQNVSVIADDAICNDVRWSRFHSYEEYTNPSALEKISVHSDNEYYKDADGVLFSKDGKHLIIYPISKKDTQYAVPAGTVRISEKAFYANQHLKKLELPESITLFMKGQHGAFEGCNSLTEIRVSSEVIPSDAFKNCKQLKSVVFSDNVKSIGDSAFYNTSIEEVELPKHLEKVEWSAFGANYAKSTLRKMTVYDSAKCSGIGKVISSWGFKNDYVIVIKDAVTDVVKNKVLMCGDGEPEKITEMLSSSWKEPVGFDYTQIDAMFKDYKDLWHRAQTARFRLEYPEELLEESKKMYTDFLARNGLKIMSKLIADNNEEDIRCYAELGALTKSNIDKVSSAVAEKKNTELTAWLLEFKNKHF